MHVQTTNPSRAVDLAEDTERKGCNKSFHCLTLPWLRCPSYHYASRCPWLFFSFFFMKGKSPPAVCFLVHLIYTRNKKYGYIFIFNHWTVESELTKNVPAHAVKTAVCQRLNETKCYALINRNDQNKMAEKVNKSRARSVTIKLDVHCVFCRLPFMLIFWSSVVPLPADIIYCTKCWTDWWTCLSVQL